MDTGSLDNTHGVGHTGQGPVEPESGKQGGVQFGEAEDGFPNTKGADAGDAEKMSTRKADGDASSRNDDARVLRRQLGDKDVIKEG